MKTIIANKSWLAESDLRLDASFHLSESLQVKRTLKLSPFPLSTIKKESNDIFLGNIFRRTYVSNPERGIPYVTGSDMIKSDINSGKYISKKQANSLEYLMLKKGWILVSCSGTLGNTVYTNELFEGRIATHDLIRIIPSDKSVLSGCLFAYLAGKYGYSLLTQSSYGGVVKHIEPFHIENIPVPIFPADKQEEIHSLIVQAAELRVEANRLLEEAHEKLSRALSLKTNNTPNAPISIKTIRNSYTERFEGSYFLSKGHSFIDQIVSQNQYKYLKDITSDIFRPGIFKRVYVQKNGIVFLGGSDITKAIPNSEKYLSKKTKGIEGLKLEKDWILCTCGGTIGNVVYVDSEIAKCTASQHILRIVPNGKIHSGYLYAFLSSEIGQEMIKSFTYGSVIPQIEPHHMQLLPIPIIDNSIESDINNIVMTHIKNVEIAKQLESKAIQLVEKEIDQWQQ